MKKHFFFPVIVLLTFVLFTTCKKEDAKPAGFYQLFSSPDTLIIPDNQESSQFYISAKPKGNVGFAITSYPEWLVINTRKGHVNGNIQTIEVAPIDQIDEGIYKGTIKITSDEGGPASVYVIMSIKGHPKIKTSTDRLSFPSDISKIEMIIENTGNGILTWSFGELPEWLNASEISGYLYPKDTRTIVFRCNRANLDQNTYLSNLKIISNSEVEIPDLQVEMVVPKFIEMKTNPDYLLFDYFTETKDVWLKNTGNTAFTWNATASNYLLISPINGSLSKGDSALIHIGVDRRNMPSGTQKLTISFENNYQVTETLDVTIHHDVQKKWLLDINILDAEFCAETNRLIVVSANPNQLSILNPETKQMENIALNARPKCVSVIPDGSMAVVGHDGFVTFVDLANKVIDVEYEIYTDAYDIVLAENKWCYITSEIKWEKISSVNYFNGQIYQTSNSLYGNYRLKKQPGSPYLYFGSMAATAYELGKVDISGGAALYLYTKYQLDNGGNFWFSEDGNRIYTFIKAVYRTSEMQEDDIEYVGSIESSNNLYWAEHSSEADKIFTIDRGDWSTNYSAASKVDVYNPSTLKYQKNYPLEPFLIHSGIEGGKLVDAEGRYIFANKPGTRLYVIVQANKESGLPFDWAVQNIEVE